MNANKSGAVGADFLEIGHTPADEPSDERWPDPRSSAFICD
jgi:hypothetical protein